MINKKIIILAIFLVSLLTISVVNATENTTGDIVSVDDAILVNSLSDDNVDVDNFENDKFIDNQDVLSSNELQNNISLENDDVGNVDNFENDKFIDNRDVLRSSPSQDKISLDKNGNDLSTLSPTYLQYTTSVSSQTISSLYGGTITVSIIPSTGAGYKYDFYLVIIDSNNHNVVKERYYNTLSTHSISYTITPTQLEGGIYTIKIINYYDNAVMASAKLTVGPIQGSDYPSASNYSVIVYSSIIDYGSKGYINMNITPASGFKYSYYYYLNIYTSSGSMVDSKLVLSTENDYFETYIISPNKLSSGNYIINIVNFADNVVMSTATLSIKSDSIMYPSSSNYSVNISNSIVNYGSNGIINMKISPASNYNYSYYYYMKVYDSSNKEKISKLYFGIDEVYSINYTIDANKLSPGKYTIKIINYDDGDVMNSAILTVKSEHPSHLDYSVDVSDTTIEYGSIGVINMNITPSSNSKYTYYYYLYIYDSDNVLKIQQTYSGTSKVYSKTYTIDANKLSRGTYKIWIINRDGYLMNTAKLTVKDSNYPLSSDYSVKVSSSTIDFGSGGSIVMNITPASDYKYAYYYFLRGYDSDNNEKIWMRCYSESNNYSETYDISPTDLSPGNYSLKIVNYADNVVMGTAKLTVINSTPIYPSSSDYSVNVPDTLMSYGANGYINMNISSDTNSVYKHYYYLKVYDSNNNEKITQVYYGTIDASFKTYTISSKQLDIGNYTIKIVNYADNVVISTAKLTVKNSTRVYPNYYDYIVKVSDSIIDYDSSGVIKMSITPAYSFTYKYDYILKVIGVNTNFGFSTTYSGTTNVGSKTYTISSNQLPPGNYTIQIINSADKMVMSSASLRINPSATIPTNPASLDYSVSVSNTTLYGGSAGHIKMSISSNSNSVYKYYYYLKVYDSNNNEIISQIYLGTKNSNSNTYSVSANQLSVGTYTVKIINYEDDVVINTSTITVKSSTYPSSSDYSVNISNSTINYGNKGYISMRITPASNLYNYRYDYYLKVYDSNNVEKISELYSGTSVSYSKSYTVDANKLSPGTYAIKIVNYYDNNVMSTATLIVNPSEYPHSSDYSVSVSDLSIDYDSSGFISMSIAPANSAIYKYYYYLKVYDSNNVEKISELYSGTSVSYSKSYTVDANKLSPGKYTIKIINYGDNNIMNISTLTVNPSTHPYSSDYSVSVSDLSIDYDSSGFISMSIAPANSAIYKYYYYLKVYDSNNNEKISELYSGMGTNYSRTYSIGSNQLSPGTYTVKIINYADNNVMTTATLTVKSSAIIPTDNSSEEPVVISKEPTKVFTKNNKVIYGNNLDFVLDNYKSGLKVFVKINGITKTYVTGKEGHIYIPTTGLCAGSYSATVIFNGNSLYEKSTSILKVTVKKATPKITAKVKTFKKSVKTKKYSITLKDNKGKVMKSTKVTIKVNKKTYAAITNKNGVATFKITKLTKKGTFKSAIIYKGNKYYNKVTKKVNIKVK